MSLGLDKEIEEGIEKREKEKEIEVKGTIKLGLSFSTFFMLVLILSGGVFVVVGFQKAYETAEIKVPSAVGSLYSRDYLEKFVKKRGLTLNESLLTNSKEVLTLPNLVLGLIWIVAGFFQLVLAFMLMVWRIAQKNLEKSNQASNKS